MLSVRDSGPKLGRGATPGGGGVGGGSRVNNPGLAMILLSRSHRDSPVADLRMQKMKIYSRDPQEESRAESTTAPSVFDENAREARRRVGALVVESRRLISSRRERARRGARGYKSGTRTRFLAGAARRRSETREVPPSTLHQRRRERKEGSHAVRHAG